MSNGYSVCYADDRFPILRWYITRCAADQYPRYSVRDADDRFPIIRWCTYITCYAADRYPNLPFKLALTISVAAVYCQLMQLMEIRFLVVLNNVVYWSGTLAYYVGRRLYSDRADKSGG